LDGSRPNIKQNFTASLLSLCAFKPFKPSTQNFYQDRNYPTLSNEIKRELLRFGRRIANMKLREGS